MRDAEIDRLLGGYATNSLSDAERQVLFEAALNDQELFNALEDEQSLKDLLDDAKSRRLIQRALERPVADPRPAWFKSGWLWGLAGSAACASLLLFFLAPSKQPLPSTATVAVLQKNEAADKVIQTPQRPMEREAQRSELPRKRAAPALIPAPPPPSRAEAPAQLAAPAGAVGGYVNSSRPTAPGVRYSVLKRVADNTFASMSPAETLQAGDAIRLNLRAPANGVVTLVEQDAAGTWRTILLGNQPMLRVAANQDYIVPDAALLIAGRDRLLRLAFTPEDFPLADLQESAKSALAQPKQRLAARNRVSSQSQQRALITDITLGPGQAAGQALVGR